MTRRRVRNTAAGLAAIAAFFAIVAFFTGFQRGQNIAYGASPDLFQDETPAVAYAPLTAENGAQFRTCASEYGWGAHMNPVDDVFCHPRFAAGQQAQRIAAYEPAGRSLAPRAKPRRALNDAVAAATARAAGLSQPQTPGAPDALTLALAPATKDYAPPTVPGGVGLTPLSPGFLNIAPNQEDPAGEDDPAVARPDTAPPDTEPPATEPPADDGPRTEKPDSEEPPGMPLPPLDPVDPDPVGPLDPTNPIDPIDPTVVPIPGAVALWVPGLAGLILAARRRKRA